MTAGRNVLFAQDKQQRNEAVIELAEQDETQAEIAEATGVPQGTRSDILTENVQMREIGKDVVDQEAPSKEPVSEAESEPSFIDTVSVSVKDEAPAESVPQPEEDEETSRISESEPDTDEAPADEHPDTSKLDSQLEIADTSAVEEEPAIPHPEPLPR